MTTVAAPSLGELVDAKTICLSVRMGRFGNSKQTSLDDATIDADKTLLRLTKMLVDSPELEAIASHDGKLSARIRKLAFKSLFRGGIYRIAIALTPTIEEMIATAQEEREALVEAACKVYKKRTKETAERLKVAYDPTDYPSPARFRASFYLEHEYISFETPGRLKAISAELWNQEREKARVRLESVADECKLAMRAGLADHVNWLVDRLSPGDDGKKKQIGRSPQLLTNFNEFLATFDVRNVTDDGELGKLAQAARAALTGLDLDTLKSDEFVQEKVLAKMATIKEVLDPLVEEAAKTTRLITYDE